MRAQYLHCILLLLFCLCLVRESHAQIDAEYDEVFLDFRFRQIINTNIVAYYKDDTFFLPVGELFNMMLVYTDFDQEDMKITGYIGNAGNTYQLDLLDLEDLTYRYLTYQYKSNSGRLTHDDFVIDQFDVYLSTDAFQQIFNMEFDVNMTYLSMRLFTDEPVQIRLRQERMLQRQRRADRTGVIDFHEPHIPRQPRVLRGGFLDYNLNFNSQNFETQNSSAAFVAGLELLSGDLQTNFSFTNSSARGSDLNWGNTRWRYYRPSGYVRQVVVGDLQSRGITFNQALRGISATNEPLYSSRVFDEYNIAETAPPYSEIEIFINERLFEFFYVDETGEYQIRLPITYGVNDIRIITYSPDGRITEVKQRLNVPFFFVPPRDFYYTAYVGRTRTSGFNPDPYYVGLFDAGYGINRKSTIRAKAEIVEGPDNSQNSVLTEYSRRFFDGLIGTFQYSPNRLTTGSFSYQTPFNSFVNVSGSRYAQAFQEVNNGIRYRYAANAFLGLPNDILPLYVRGGVDVTDFTNLTSRTIDGTLTSRVGRVSLSLGFRNLERSSATLSSSQTTYNYSLSYSTPRTQNFPRLLRGIFFRAQLTALESFGDIDRYNLSISRSIFGSGQLQANYTHFNATGQGTFFVSLSFDIPYARFNSSVRGNRDNFVVNQAVRGSMAYFPQENIFLFDNRNQVGRSAVVFNTYVDTDGSGGYSEGDYNLPYNSMRIQGAGARSFQKKDRLIYTQLRQYERYNVEVNEAMIQDPSLVALQRQFSFTTDPNQFKYIEVPFSRSGIVEGFVFNNIRGNQEPVSGLNVRIFNKQDSTVISARTFFDGSFYKEELIPGHYVAYPDSNQLRILGVRSEPAVYPFEIQTSEYGDIVDIGFDLFSLREVLPEPEPQPSFFLVQTAMMSTLPRALMAREEVEKATGRTFELQYSMSQDLYRLFSEQVDSESVAIALRDDIRRQTQFRDAFIINDLTYNEEDIFFGVQIGAFRPEGNANQQAEEAKTRYGLDVQVVRDEVRGLHKVQSTELLSWSDATALRSRILEGTPYDDTFLITRPSIDLQNFTYWLLIGSYNQRDYAESMARSLERITGYTYRVRYYSPNNMYQIVLQDIRSLDDAFKIRRELSEKYNLVDTIILQR